MPCDYSKYPKNWKAIRNEILERAKNQCECDGRCKPNQVMLDGNVLYTHPWVGPIQIDITSGALNVLNFRCQELHMRRPQTFGGKRVILTVAHMNHRTRDVRRKNLRAMCQLCHNRYDASYRAANRKINAEK